MKRRVTLALVLTMGLAAQMQGQIAGADRSTARGFTEGTPVVIVGEVSSQPRDLLNEKKMQVAIGPAKMDYTLHLSDAQMIGPFGAKFEADDFTDKMWVRAEGSMMNDPRRIKVKRLQVIGKDSPTVQQSAFFRPGFDRGYVMAVAGSRQIFPEVAGALLTPAPLVIVGRVSDDTGALETTRKIQVDAAGNTWTLSVPKEIPVVDAKGEKISVHEIAQGQWIRAHGWQTDDLRLRTGRIENLGPEATYRASTLYRAGAPLGYVERQPGTGVQFSPLRMTGVITAVNTQDGLITLRDAQGKERTLALETVTISINGRPAQANTLRVGQSVTVEGSEIRF